MAGIQKGSSDNLTSPIPHLLNADFLTAVARLAPGLIHYAGRDYYQRDTDTHYRLKALSKCFAADGTTPATLPGTWGTLEAHWVTAASAAGVPTNGTNGTNGNRILALAAAPALSDGNLADLAIVSAVGDLYEKTSSGWALRGNLRGPAGTGSTSTATSGVTAFNTRAGSVTLTAADVLSVVSSANQLVGGLHSAANKANMLAIPATLRDYGMTVIVYADLVTANNGRYDLATDLQTWIKQGIDLSGQFQPYNAGLLYNTASAYVTYPDPVSSALRIFHSLALAAPAVQPAPVNSSNALNAAWEEISPSAAAATRIPLYNNPGPATDGPMTQAATTAALGLKVNTADIIRATSAAYYTSPYTNTLTGYATAAAAITACTAEEFGLNGAASIAATVYINPLSPSNAITATPACSVTSLTGTAADPVTVSLAAGLRVSTQNLRRVSVVNGTIVLVLQGLNQLASATVGGTLEFTTGTGFTQAVLLTDTVITAWTNPAGFPVTVTVRGISTIPAAPYPAGTTVIDQRPVKYPQIGAGLAVSATGVVSATASAPAQATNTALGTVRGGGTGNVSINLDGSMTAPSGTSGTAYTLPQSSASVLGGIKLGANLAMNATSGQVDANAPQATSTSLGTVKAGISSSIGLDGSIKPFVYKGDYVFYTDYLKGDMVLYGNQFYALDADLLNQGSNPVFQSQWRLVADNAWRYIGPVANNNLLKGTISTSTSIVFPTTGFTNNTFGNNLSGTISGSCNYNTIGDNVVSLTLNSGSNRNSVGSQCVGILLNGAVDCIVGLGCTNVEIGSGCQRIQVYNTQMSSNVTRLIVPPNSVDQVYRNGVLQVSSTPTQATATTLGTVKGGGTGNVSINADGSMTATSDTLSALTTTTGSIALDFNAATVQTLSATGTGITFTTANVAALKTKELYLSNTTGAAITLTFPAWSFFPGPAPTALAAGKQAVLTLRSLGTTDATIKAAYVAQA